jgi:Outer membrane protein beta-barrel domain
MKFKFLSALAAIMLVTATAAPAHADVLLTPFLGGLFKGQLPTQKVTYGASVAAMGKGIIGGEVDFSWAPKFVDETTTSGAVREANITGNVIVGIPIGGSHGASIRPYAVGGIGILRATATASDFDDKLTTNDFAYDLGGGVMGTINTHFGLRADLRYFRTTSDTNQYKFYRGTGGVVFKF